MRTQKIVKELGRQERGLKILRDWHLSLAWNNVKGEPEGWYICLRNKSDAEDTREGVMPDKSDAEVAAMIIKFGEASLG